MSRLLSLIMICMLSITPVVQAAHACCLTSDSTRMTAPMQTDASIDSSTHCHSDRADAMAGNSDLDTGEADNGHQCAHNGSCCLGMLAAVGPPLDPLVRVNDKSPLSIIQLLHYPAIIQRLDRPPSTA